MRRPPLTGLCFCTIVSVTAFGTGGCIGGPTPSDDEVAPEVTEGTNVAGPLTTLEPTRAASEAKVYASDGGEYNAFGLALASDGNRLIVGAHREGDAVGAAYLYEWDGASWAHELKVIASDRTRNDFFGIDVDISGDAVIVGANTRDPVDRQLQNNNYGGVYFFRRIDGSWVEEGFAQASDRELNREFGEAVAISGDYAVVGAQFATVEGRPNQGKAYAFKYEDGTWTETQVLIAPDGDETDEFGESVDIDGDYILVGADDHRGGPDGHRLGAVWVYHRDEQGVWNFDTKFMPSDLEDGNKFGTSIEVDGDVVIVGAPDATGQEVATGAAYVFRRDANGWSQEAKLAAADGQFADTLGTNVAIRGDVAVAGGPLAYVGDEIQQGVTYVFRRTASGWTQDTKLTASDGGSDDLFGGGVAIGAAQIVIGASGEAGPDSDPLQGGVYSYGGLLP